MADLDNEIQLKEEELSARLKAMRDEALVSPQRTRLDLDLDIPFRIA